MSDFTPGKPFQLTPLVTRVVAPNASIMTGPGTNSYLLGKHTKAVIDPGPSDETHIDAIINAADGKSITRIFATHTHSDHSPGTALLKDKTGAEVIGMRAPEGVAQDLKFAPDTEPKNQQIFDCDDFSLQMLHTPGHASNHFCFLLRDEKLLFTGDHLMEGSTVVIIPPDGRMGAYINSLNYLKDFEIDALAPGHGNIIHTPFELVDSVIKHRLKRESKVIKALSETGGGTLKHLVPYAYDDTPVNLHGWARYSLLAHLIKLEEDGKAVCTADTWTQLA